MTWESTHDLRISVLRPFDRVFSTVMVVLVLQCGWARTSTAQCSALPADLSAWWTGEGDVRDTVGVADGLLVNGATFAPGQVGQAFALDGVDDWVTVPDHAGLAFFPGAFTLELWVKLDSFAGAYQTFLHKGAGNNRLWFAVRPDGKVENYPEIIGTTVLVPGTWYHLALVADATHEYLYLNGGLEAAVARTIFTAANGPITFGSEPGHASEFVDGLIDEVSLYARALTAAEIQAIHAAGAAGKCSDAIETFDGNVLDLQRWRVSVPLNASTVTQDGEVILMSDGTNGNVCFTPYSFGPGIGVGSRRAIAGDFDIQVAFRGFSGPAADATRAYINVHQDPDNQLQLKRTRNPAVSVNGIQTVYRVGGVTSDTGISFDPVASGTLRIVRNGNQMSTFFDGGLHASVSGFTGPVVVTMMVQGGASSSVRYDNFFIRNGSVLEPPLGCAGPAVADAGADDTVDEGELVQLDGTGSSDPDEDDLTYAWTQVAGPLVLLSDAHSATPAFTAPLVPMGGATLTFQLVVDDGLAPSAPDTVDITVSNINHPPVALAGDDQAVAELSPVELDGSNSYDTDSEELTFSWMQTAGTPVTLYAIDPAKPTFTAPMVGLLGETLTFELLVSDGLDSDVDTVDVLVENVNHDPIADAGVDQTRAEGQLVTLDASASGDPDGDSLTYDWTQLGGPLVLLSDASSSGPSFTAPPVGLAGETLVFRVTVDDGYGGSDDDDVSITVQDGDAPPACELARASQTELWPPNHKLVPITILGVTDPENGAIQITILGVTQDEPLNGLGDGDTAPDAVIQGSTVLIRAERSGTGNGRVYRITFQAEDGAGGTCTGSVNVCVPHGKGKQAPPCVDDGQAYDSVGP